MAEEPADESVDASEEALRSGDAAGWAFYNGSGLVPVRSFNSSGGAIRVASSGVGVYTAAFDGLSGSGGNVQVNAAGGDGQQCKVASWGTAGAALQVNIRCHTAAGQAANSPFVVSYARFAGSTAVSSAGAHVWVDRPSTEPVPRLLTCREAAVPRPPPARRLIAARRGRQPAVRVDLLPEPCRPPAPLARLSLGFFARVALFTRSQRGLDITPAAVSLVPYADAMASAESALRRAVSGKAHELRGSVRIMAARPLGSRSRTVDPFDDASAFGRVGHEPGPAFDRRCDRARRRGSGMTPTRFAERWRSVIVGARSPVNP
jgi:hypothetical protein